MAAVRPASFESLATKLKTLSSLQQAQGLLEWDQLVMMPHSSDTAQSRGAQMGALASVIHEKSTNAELQNAIEAAEKDLDSITDPRDKGVVRDARRNFDLESKIPSELAEKKATLSSTAYGVWTKARTNDNFAEFRDTLNECFSVAREVALARGGPQANPYDVLLDEFERGMPAQRINDIFMEVKSALQPLIQRVNSSASKPSIAALSPPSTDGSFDLEAQRKLNEDIVKAIGFDMEHGRVDVSVHPFTSAFSPNDVRITSRFNEKEWYQGLAGSVHECGHALYERQVRPTNLPVDSFLSMGVHESQSLFWERHIGLSRAFWKWAGQKVRDELGVQADDEEIYGAVNAVSPSLIRVEADELTYPMHVILRYELEQKLLNGEIKVDDVPSQWNAAMKDLLGVDVPSDAKGCLQDVHWSALAIGYFPTYLLGSMMAAQLSHYIRNDAEFTAANGTVDALVQNGNFAPIKEWLRVKIHDKGSLHPSLDELLQATFGEPLKPKYFIDYLTEKFTELYKL